MNPEIRNIVVNNDISKKYAPKQVAKAVKTMTTQRQADLFNDEAIHNKGVMEAHPVFDQLALRRMRVVGGSGLVFLLVSAAVMFGIWPDLEDPTSASMPMLLAAAACLAGMATAVSLLWKSWTLRNHAVLQELTAADVEEALALRTIVGEQHKMPPVGWEKPAIAFARGLECAGFSYLALLGLGALPPFAALGVAVALGVVITGSVSMLGRFHAQREVIAKGLTMYRARQQLADELMAAEDERAIRYQAEAAQLREALSPANMGQFAAPSKFGIGVLWVFVGLMIGLALALRILFGAAISAKAVVGAGMLAVATGLIFWASYRMSERFHSVAGDMGQRAMNIAARFGTVPAFNSAIEQHRGRVSLLFRRVVLEAARVNQLRLDAQDPLRPRMPLKFAIEQRAAEATEPVQKSQSAPTTLPVSTLPTTAPTSPAPPTTPDKPVAPTALWTAYAAPIVTTHIPNQVYRGIQ